MMLAERIALSWTIDKTCHHESYRSLRDGSFLLVFQAFHAWLPSFRPYGTRAGARVLR
jgi:hypothetical protein